MTPTLEAPRCPEYRRRPSAPFDRSMRLMHIGSSPTPASPNRCSFLGIILLLLRQHFPFSSFPSAAIRSLIHASRHECAMDRSSKERASSLSLPSLPLSLPQRVRGGVAAVSRRTKYRISKKRRLWTSSSIPRGDAMRCRSTRPAHSWLRRRLPAYPRRRLARSRSR